MEFVNTCDKQGGFINESGQYVRLDLQKINNFIGGTYEKTYY